MAADIREDRITATETTGLLTSEDTIADEPAPSSATLSVSGSYRDDIEGPGDGKPPSGYGSINEGDDVEAIAAPGEGGHDELAEEQKYSRAFIARVVLALLVGAFTANADGSLVMATHPMIGSEFNALQDSSWLSISYTLAGAATQSLYAKLSDIYGRKPVLLFSYLMFAVGCAIIGFGQSMGQVILGRVISGSAGNGMGILASVIITDLSPLRDIASWQSYLNVAATVGRSLGGPIGGWLADSIGWRWSFLVQSPIFLLALVLAWIILPTLTGVSATDAQRVEDLVETKHSKWGRIDFLGAFLLGSGILTLLLPIEIGGQWVPWTHPVIASLFVAGAILLSLFAWVEANWAREPIFPLKLLASRNVVLVYIVLVCQVAAQLGMMFTVPLYFQVTQRVSYSVAGAHLMPAVIGNTVGAIVAGIVIQRTGKYKALTAFAAAASCFSFLLLILTWKGHTNWVQSLYIFPSGFGAGMSQSAAFVALQASIDRSDRAAAISGLFLAGPVGMLLGIAGATAILMGVLRAALAAKLTKLGLSDSVIHEAVENAVKSVGYIDTAPPEIAKAVVSSYVDGLEWSHGLSLACSLVALSAALLLREKPLSKQGARR
ncbi:major facilitator superfamily transporter [Xylariales sp. PMI_506]|nr:major facilitator superfamily transporter [Xylariales sp. PMI_506]